MRVFLTAGCITLIACASLHTSFSSSYSSGGCIQQYNFFLKMQFNDLFWIGESIGGDCQSSQLLQIMLDNEKEPHVTQLFLKEYNRWQWFESANGYLKDETVVELEKKGSSFQDKSYQLKVKPSPYNNELLQTYQEKFYGVCAEDWNKKLGNSGINLPIVDGWKAELKYAHPKGLYFNYDISHAYFFPETNYLLIFTNQPLMCSGYNTQHGFMILKISKGK